MGDLDVLESSNQKVLKKFSLWCHSLMFLSGVSLKCQSLVSLSSFTAYAAQQSKKNQKPETRKGRSDKEVSSVKDGPDV